MASSSTAHTPPPSRLVEWQLRARTWGQDLGHRLGVHVALHTPRSSASMRRALMLSALGVDVLFDVGANEGQYGTELRSGGYAGRIVSFEPQSVPLAALRAVAGGDPRWDVVPVALGAEAGTLTINVARATGASSLLPAEARHLAEDPGARVERTEEVEVRRLDDLTAEHTGPTSVVGLKLDVQGFEGQVLAGAEALLATVAYVECELTLAPYYEGQAPVPELIERFYRAGLRLAGTDHGHVDDRTGMVSWLDATFVRHDVPAPVNG